MRSLSPLLVLLSAGVVQADDLAFRVGLGPHQAAASGFSKGPFGLTDARADHAEGIARMTALNQTGVAVGYALRLPDGRYVAHGHMLTAGPRPFFGSSRAEGGHGVWIDGESLGPGAGRMGAGAFPSPWIPAHTRTFGRGY